MRKARLSDAGCRRTLLKNKLFPERELQDVVRPVTCSVPDIPSLPDIEAA